MIVNFNCFYWHINDLNVMITVGNITKLFSPVILTLIRFQDPFLKNLLLNFKNKLLYNQKLIQSSMSMNLIQSG